MFIIKMNFNNAVLIASFERLYLKHKAIHASEFKTLCFPGTDN